MWRAHFATFIKDLFSSFRWRGGLGFCGAHRATCDQRRTRQGRDHAIGTQETLRLADMVRRDHAVGLGSLQQKSCGWYGKVWWISYPGLNVSILLCTVYLYCSTCFLFGGLTAKRVEMSLATQVKQFSTRRCCLERKLGAHPYLFCGRYMFWPWISFWEFLI